MDNLIAVSKPKHSLLPILVVLFLISYGLMSMLIVEQGRTIDTQRYLIQSLFSDSAELSAMKGNAIQKLQAAPKTRGEANGQSQPQAPSGAVPSTRTPAAQLPSTQTPSAQTPSTQVPSASTQSSSDSSKQNAPRGSAKVERNTSKAHKRALQKPPSYTSDTANERRALVSI